MLRSIGKQPGESVESVPRKKKKAMVGRICGEGFKPEMKEWTGNGYERGELMEPTEEVPLVGLGDGQKPELILQTRGDVN